MIDSPPLVDRVLRGPDLESALSGLQECPRLDLDRNQVLDLEKIANGTFTPLTGFMGSADVASVVRRIRLADDTPWSIPIVLQVPLEAARRFEPGERILLWNSEEDRASGILDLEEVFPLDLVQQAREVYGTTERAHPGVDRLMGAGDHALAGPIRLLERSRSLIPARYDRDPADIREEIRSRGWRTVTGFQTRNLGHKAHERLQKMGLELTDGLLIHPLIGWKKAGDMLPDVILEGYEVLIDRYYPKDAVILSALTTAMRYAGPREALFHAIIRRNFGCTHFIVGRDHAGVGGYYEKYAAHRIFDRFSPGELGITPLLLHGPSYCSVCDEIVTEKTCPHGPEGHVEVSGTEIRAMISRGDSPPATIMRPEIAEFLVRKAREGAVFF